MHALGLPAEAGGARARARALCVVVGNRLAATIDRSHLARNRRMFTVVWDEEKERDPNTELQRLLHQKSCLLPTWTRIGRTR